MNSLLNNSDNIRILTFVAILLILAAAEHLFPRRELTAPKGKRWFANLGIVVIDNLTARFLLPLTPLVLAQKLEHEGSGLFRLIGINEWLEIALSLAALDLIIYLQHRIFHRTPLLWRLHKVHHTDLDLDVSSATRFHPLEIIISLLIKIASVYALGISPAAIVIFEIVLNATAMFSHSNLDIPPNLDKWLRFLVVTPDMHRVHHSIKPAETDSNFGFNLPWWDRLLGTYRDQPSEGHEKMTIGLKSFRDITALGLKELLILPFLQKRKGLIDWKRNN